MSQVDGRCRWIERCLIALTALGLAAVVPCQPTVAQSSSSSKFPLQEPAAPHTTIHLNDDANDDERVAALLALVGERLDWMPAVAHSKWILGVPVHNETREHVVLTAAITATQAAAQQLRRPAPKTQVILNFYAAQIEAAKTLQYRWLEQHAVKTEASGSTTEVQRQRAQERLNQDIRPALIALGDKIAVLIIRVAVSPLRPDAQAVQTALQRHNLPQEHLEALQQAIEAF